MASFNCPKCKCHSYKLKCNNLVQECLCGNAYRFAGRWYLYPDWSGWIRATELCSERKADDGEQITFW